MGIIAALYNMMSYSFIVGQYAVKREKNHSGLHSGDSEVCPAISAADIK